MSFKNYNILTIMLTISALVVFALPTIIIDPYFHYHKPLECMEYPMENERYQNNGIVRHFEYDAIITGTSMVQNFKVSEMNELFGVNAIKVPYPGAQYKEINDNLFVALESNPDTKIILRCLDYSRLIADKDAEFHEIADSGYQYPYYLIDKNPLNDVSYILNKSVFLQDLRVYGYTKAGEKTPSFDEYSIWVEDGGKELVLSRYQRPDKVGMKKVLDEETKNMIRENIRQNVVSTAEKYPNTMFYLYFPPYSICYWDSLNQTGAVDYYIDAEKIAIEEMLTCQNIKLYSFANAFDITTNLDNYVDNNHYVAEINSEIQKWMKEDEYRVTEDNYLAYLDSLRTFYSNYSYDEIW